MAGKPGRGGRPRKPLREHLLAGTWRRDRHGERPSNLAVLPTPASAADWMPVPADVAKLGSKARQILAAVLERYQLDPVEGQTLLLALAARTRLEALEEALEAQGVCGPDGAPSSLLVAAAREQRSFVAAWSLLRLEVK